MSERASLLRSLLAPLRVWSPTAVRLLIAGQVALFLLAWAVATPAIIPKPWEVVAALRELLARGVLGHLYISLLLYLEALALAAIYSLAISYSAALVFFQPLASAWTKLRFLGMIGLPFFLTLYIHNAHLLKLALLVFSISVFMVTSMLDVIAVIPEAKYDLARTLRMGDWQVVWEVIVLGRIDVAFDVLRQNSAIGWMMLGMVEGLFRSEGGIGTVLVTENKYFNLAGVAAIQLLILGCGLLQDYAIGVLKNTVCPYASLLLRRR